MLRKSFSEKTISQHEVSNIFSLQHVHNLEMKILLPFSMHSAASKGKNDHSKDKLPPCCRSINDKYCNK